VTLDTAASRPARPVLGPAAVAAGTALGLTAATPREVHERLLPLLGDDLDFARVLRVQLDAARASIFGRPARGR
jgi:hypothetical protein